MFFLFYFPQFAKLVWRTSVVLLRPVRTWSGFDPHRSHTSIITSTNWIATGSIHFDPVCTTNLTRDDSYTRPIYRHVIAYLPLAVTQSCFWLSRPAGFGHCLLPIYFLTTHSNGSKWAGLILKTPTQHKHSWPPPCFILPTTVLSHPDNWDKATRCQANIKVGSGICTNPSDTCYYGYWRFFTHEPTIKREFTHKSTCTVVPCTHYIGCVSNKIAKDCF